MGSRTLSLLQESDLRRGHQRPRKRQQRGGRATLTGNSTPTWEPELEGVGDAARRPVEGPGNTGVKTGHLQIAEVVARTELPLRTIRHDEETGPDADERDALLEPARTCQHPPPHRWRSRMRLEKAEDFTATPGIRLEQSTPISPVQS